MALNNNSSLTNTQSCVTLSDNDTKSLFLGLRQSLLMQITAEERAYHEKRAHLYAQLGFLESFLGIERTKKR